MNKSQATQYIGHAVDDALSERRIERVRRGVYIAFNRTEFFKGAKTYSGLDSLRADLINR